MRTRSAFPNSHGWSWRRPFTGVGGKKGWSRGEFLAAAAQFAQDDLDGYWTWLPLDRAVVGGAAQLYARLPQHIFLRSSDCLHLSTALHHRFKEIYTFDAHQSSAAVAAGLRPMAP